MEQNSGSIEVPNKLFFLNVTKRSHKIKAEMDGNSERVLLIM